MSVLLILSFILQITPAFINLTTILLWKPYVPVDLMFWNCILSTDGFCFMWICLHAFFQINASTHQHQTVTDSPYAKPNKATKSSPSPQPSANIQCQQLTTSAGSSTAGSGKQNQLDSMLGNLQADMSRQGVNTTQKGCCNACDKPIVGQVHPFFSTECMITFVECDKCPFERL